MESTCLTQAGGASIEVRDAPFLSYSASRVDLLAAGLFGCLRSFWSVRCLARVPRGCGRAERASCGSSCVRFGRRVQHRLRAVDGVMIEIESLARIEHRQIAGDRKIFDSVFFSIVCTGVAVKNKSLQSQGLAFAASFRANEAGGNSTRHDARQRSRWITGKSGTSWHVARCPKARTPSRA